MHCIKIEAISQYLSDKFPDCEIEQDPKHIVGEPWSFKIHLPDFTYLLLKVDDAFIKDNDIQVFLTRFNHWRLTERLGRDTKQGIFVSEKGLESFHY